MPTHNNLTTDNIPDILKNTLDIRQCNQSIYIEGTLGDQRVKVKRLMFLARFSEKKYQVDNEKFTNQFSFQINLKDHPEICESTEEVFNLYIVVTTDKKTAMQLNSLKSKLKNNHDGDTDDYILRLGKFHNTKTTGLQPFKVNNNYYLLYKTIKGNISLLVNREIKPKPFIEINNFKNNTINLKLVLI
ncbi:hypothetical protein [Lentibacillus salinarum]|uniref:Uncharacterized protein n=1 Tax=Lentibacillus salinarum TaxID=446820 RepID=A0ABW3ZZ28_9BACI